MGLGVNIIIFTVIFSGFLQIADPTVQTPFTSLLHDLTGKSATTDAQGVLQFTDVTDNQVCFPIPGVGDRCFGSLAIPGLFLVLLGVAVAGALGGIIPGLSAFPNPYIIFSGVGILLLTFFTFPVSLLTSTQAPNELKLVLGGFFMVAYLLAFVSFYKSGGGSW